MSKGDLISREALREDLRRFFTVEVLEGIEPKTLFAQIMHDIDNAPTVEPERDYSQGWHDAITKALNEAYTITTEDGSFKVVQTETLEGLGMSMPMPERPQEDLIKAFELLKAHCKNRECNKDCVFYRELRSGNNIEQFCGLCEIVTSDDKKGGEEE